MHLPNFNSCKRNCRTLRRALSFLPVFFLLAVHPATAAEAALDDAALIAKIQKDTLRYFVYHSNRETGLTLDSSRPGSPASVAATGFSLAALAIGDARGWIESEHAQSQIRKTLKTLLTKAGHERGFFYHFLDPETGERVWESEASSIDTALLAAGALLAGRYYPGTDIEIMARQIYERVEWPWMMNGSDLMCMGWKPETGFLPYYWDSYNEHLIIQALAIGSPTHPIPESAWNAWDRLEDTYRDKTIVYTHDGSLFTYQYPQAFIDFRQLNDQGINYFENSRKAALANYEYAMEARDKYRSYTPSSWGLSASVGPDGYLAYGAKPGLGRHDGTVAPYAAISSIVFTPEYSMKAVRFFYEEYRDKIYDHFGFKAAFNVDRDWWADEYLGIDQGITVLMLENYLNNGAVWEKFMTLPSIQSWIHRTHLSEGSPAPAA